MKVGHMRISNVMTMSIPFSPCFSPHLSLPPPPPLHVHPPSSPSSWSPPPPGLMKINFDGASKGNLGPTKYGGMFMDVDGKILKVYYGFMGTNSNNVEKLRALIQGLQVACNHHFSKLIVEGDSHLIIHMLTKIQNGSSPCKASHN